MRIARADAHIIAHEGCTPYQFIERVGRICYKSEDRITEDSAIKFIKNLAERQHTAMFEHEHIFINCDNWVSDAFIEGVETKYKKYIQISPNCISGSFRSFFDLFIAHKDTPSIVVGAIYKLLVEEYPLVFDSIELSMDKWYYDADIDEYVNGMGCMSRQKLVEVVDQAYISHHLPHTVVFTCDRGVSHELVRHRPCGFAQESTRYCNYNHDKFGKEITVIQPCFFEENTMKYKYWLSSMLNSELNYFKLLENGATPQEARDVLPTSLKTEIVVTATEEEWQHIINLRYHGTTGAPHPQMKEIMDIAYPMLCAESDNRLK